MANISCGREGDAGSGGLNQCRGCLIRGLRGDRVTEEEGEWKEEENGEEEEEEEREWE